MQKELTPTSTNETKLIIYNIEVYNTKVIRSLDILSSNKYFIDQIETLLLNNQIEYKKTTKSTILEQITYE